ncbi:MAG: hypothetical protein WA919_00770 [Coleofasciculaceae cyanobacterium]
MSETKSSITLTPTPTAAEFDENIELERQVSMSSLEAIKLILEITAIFLTFPEYAPLLAFVVTIGAVYSLLKGKKKKKDLPITNLSEIKEQCPVSQEPTSAKTPPKTK